ncbi:uncharacterized protein LOC128228342 [Mya arenaria]|uniref:uncharacterized protein LOC128228342 n=1 Tax=Mya arenaria TaxID=6604 RepID=UPI0022E10B43|nr:uncharacterized protein LOC128228342 [Mya arenaria]
MKTLLQTLLCFVSVAQCLSLMGTYSGRQRTVVKKPVVFDQNPIFHPKPIGPKPYHPKPVVKPVLFGVENSVFGQRRLWGNGAEPDFNRLLSGGNQFGRQATKETHNIHNMVKASVGTGIGVGPMSHNIVKSSVGNGIGVNHVFHMSAQSAMSGRHIGGIGVDPITHNIAKSTSVGTGGIRVDPFNHNIAKQMQFQHNTIKSSSGIGHIVAGKPSYGVGFSSGTVRVDHHGLTSHNIGNSHNLAKATGVPTGSGFMNPGSHINRKAEAQAGHDFAKASGVHIGNGFMNQGSHISRNADAGHNFAKSGGMNEFNLFGQTSGSNFVHDMNKAQSGIGQLNGFGHMIRPAGGASVVHNVNKVGAGGAAGVGHDRLAAEVGHGLAKNSVANAVGIVDMGSGGAVSMGDPFANQAAARLAQESLHVAQKTVGMASNGGGAFIQPVMHKPAMPKKPVVFPTGYGGRPRRVRGH